MTKWYSWWISNRTASKLLMISITLCGLLNFFLIEREFLPASNQDQIAISSYWPGASSTEVQEQIIYRIERAMSDLGGILHIESSAYQEVGEVTISVESTADFERIYQDIKARIDSINDLPSDAYSLNTQRKTEDVGIIFLALYGDSTRKELQDKASEIKEELSTLPGIGTVEITTAGDEEISIEVSERDLKKFNLTHLKIAKAIRLNSLNLSLGEIETNSGRYNLQSRGLATDPSQFEGIVIKQSTFGNVLRLGDIAEITHSFKLQNFNSTFNNLPAMIIKITAPEESQIVQMSNTMRSYVNQKNSTLPDNLELKVWIDLAENFKDMLALIIENAAIGILLVFLILSLFLRLSIAFYVSLGILVAFSGTFAVAPLIGITLNIFSIFSFMLVVGIVVDDAIVIGESIHTQHENGSFGSEASLVGVQLVCKPIFFAVLTTMLAFLPWAYLSVSYVSFTEQITFTVIATLFFSIIEALFILPAHLSHCQPTNNHRKSIVIKTQSYLSSYIYKFANTHYRNALSLSLKFSLLTVFLFTSSLIIAFFSVNMGLLKTTPSIGIDSELIRVEVHVPLGTGFQRVLQIQKQVDAATHTLNNKARSEFRIDYAPITSNGSYASDGLVQAYLGLAPISVRKSITNEMIESKFRSYLGKIPDATSIKIHSTQSGSKTDNIVILISSNNREELESNLPTVISTLNNVRHFTDIYSSSQSYAQGLIMSQASISEALGLSFYDISLQARHAIFGLEVQRISKSATDISVILRHPKSERGSLEALNDIFIRNANDLSTPLSGLVDISYEKVSKSIHRRDRKHAAYIELDIDAKITSRSDVIRELRSNLFPKWQENIPGLSMTILGQEEENARQNKELIVLGLMVLGLTYVVLSIAFESYIQPILILLAIPFAFVGMVIGSMLTSTLMTPLSVFGFFAASGVSINDNLILLSTIKAKNNNESNFNDVLINSCISRFRAIFLTTLTTFVGLIPMLTETSAQALFLKPLIIALAFGVLFNFIVTLFYLPSLYSIFKNMQRVIGAISHSFRHTSEKDKI